MLNIKAKIADVTWRFVANGPKSCQVLNKVLNAITSLYSKENKQQQRPPPAPKAITMKISSISECLFTNTCLVFFILRRFSLTRSIVHAVSLCLLCCCSSLQLCSPSPVAWIYCSGGWGCTRCLPAWWQQPPAPPCYSSASSSGLGVLGWGWGWGSVLGGSDRLWVQQPRNAAQKRCLWDAAIVFGLACIINLILNQFTV